MNDSVYLTTSLPYVNALPHLGHALEFVQADVLARHRRLRGQPVRLLSGTDENALKNVTAARAAKLDTATFVGRNAAAFAELQHALNIGTDDFIRTSVDSRHLPGVERLWHACAERGDFYRRQYVGLYCPGCEQFYTPDELVDGRCREHGTRVEVVSEENWFFRLSAYTDQLSAAILDDRLRIEPVERRNEVLALLKAGLSDISVSRPAERGKGWGIPVPGDTAQVIYVWWEALCNYVTALEYGGEQATYRHWWRESAERIHIVGKGIARFHAVYWPALLLSAGEPLPTAVFVHEYLTLDGAKISKSTGRNLPPAELIERYGCDALRWWLASDVARLGDTDFTEERLQRRYKQDLVGGIGNLVNRTCALVNQSRDGRIQPERADAVGVLVEGIRTLPAVVDDALAQFDLRTDTSRRSGRGSWPNGSGQAAIQSPVWTASWPPWSVPVECWPAKSPPSCRRQPYSSSASSAEANKSIPAAPSSHGWRPDGTPETLRGLRPGPSPTP
jgi:methionyl-tRNA synthetase